MSMDLTGINNINEYYTNHYFSSVFEENATATLSAWRAAAKESEENRTPWALLKDCARLYYVLRDKSNRARNVEQVLPHIAEMADNYIVALNYPKADPFSIQVEDHLETYPYLEMKKANGAPLLWVLLTTRHGRDEESIMNGMCFDSTSMNTDTSNINATAISNEDLASKIFFNIPEPPRWLLFFSEDTVALIDRNKWNEKRYLEFDLDEIFGRREESTLQAMAVLLHRESLCPDEGESLLDKLDENSHKHAAGVSQDLKYALRESIELLGNEVLYDMAHRLGRSFETDPVIASELSIECLRYMYRMLFVLFIESRPELGYSPMKAQTYMLGYSLESLRDVADNIREDTAEVGEGFYLHATLTKLFDLIYSGYPHTEQELRKLQQSASVHDVFVIEPLKAHIFDPEYTPLITNAKLRNRVMLRIVDLMSLARSSGRRNESRGRISYSNLGINQMGAVYEALLSYRGFVAEETLFEVKRARDEINELDVGYFVPERELDNYSEDERARYSDGKLRKYEKGTFIYRLAGREREKSASYYTPEVLTKCLVKYALKELLEGKTADEILHLTVCEPAMGSAAFLNEAINQLAEAYLDRKQKELSKTVSHENRAKELQQIKMYIADRNVYGIDLNPIAVELAEVSLWLNTIHSGGFVPWFGTQLVCGNSLIGARRQCYRVEQLQANRAPAIWYENAPERLLVGARRISTNKLTGRQVYHFLAGDPGMANYTDKVIKDLASDNIKAIKDWNKQFTKPFSDDDVATALRLSTVIDELWEKQIALRREISDKTSDAINVWGQPQETHSSHTTIREKDMIYKKLYKSEEMRNAGPYARLKFAMDYWSALWFWPIDKAELLPNRSEFLADMSFILEGTIDAYKSVSEAVKIGQLSLFPSEAEQLVMDMTEQYKDLGIVDIQALCAQQPRLDIVRQINEQQRFLHWELEFADLFAEHGGFDFIIGNPPWILLGWNEKDLLSDSQPMFFIRDLSATQTTHQRDKALENVKTKANYFSGYESTTGMQSFLNVKQNYPDLMGMKANLYKCFLPQAWCFGNKIGVSAFVHPEGVYDDTNGGLLRESLYPRLRYRFHFANEKKLFTDIKDYITFCLNIYSNASSKGFDMIANLYDPLTIEQCYDDSITGLVPGIKDTANNWNVNGHPGRVVHVGKKELTVFAKLLDGSDNWKRARLPIIHAEVMLEVLERFVIQEKTLSKMKDEIHTTQMWNETNAQIDGTILCNVHFPETPIGTIYSGAHIGVANPYFQTTRREYRVNSDYDRLDLTLLPEDYLIRVKYQQACETGEFLKRVPVTTWGSKVTDDYHIINREMVGCSSERTLMSAIAAPGFSYVNTVFGVSVKDKSQMVCLAGCESSIPFDYLVKTIGKGHVNYSTNMLFPYLPVEKNIIIRTLLLNCLTVYYKKLWNSCWDEDNVRSSWTKIDPRLRAERFTSIKSEWTWDTPLRTDYERRQALVEIDVLTAMALGMTLNQLKTIYRIQFPVLQQNEEDTWYDQNGRIVFTNNRSLTGVGFSRPEWEEKKEAASGKTFFRNIMDDTMPGGPIERTIEYVAPFDRCSREQDYETAWRFFEEKYPRDKA